jgi:hypothetical protein
MVDVPNRPEYQSELFKKDLAVRRDVPGAYRGIPACLEAFKIATEVFKEVDDARK